MLGTNPGLVMWMFGGEIMLLEPCFVVGGEGRGVPTSHVKFIKWLCHMALPLRICYTPCRFQRMSMSHVNMITVVSIRVLVVYMSNFRNCHVVLSNLVV